MEVNTGLQLKEKAFQRHQVSFTVEQIAILHRLVITHLLRDLQDEGNYWQLNVDALLDAEFSTHECSVMSCANVSLAAALTDLLDRGYKLDEEVTTADDLLYLFKVN